MQSHSLSTSSHDGGSVKRHLLASPAPIFVIDGDKGGPGKSFLGRTVTFCVEDLGLEWSGFDLDPRNYHLKRFHPYQNVVQFNWLKDEDWNALYQAITEIDLTTSIIIDLPSQVGAVTQREFPRLGATAKFMGRPLIRLWTLAPGFDSLNLLRQSLELVQLKDTVAVLNLKNGNRESFSLWNESKTKKALLEAGSCEVFLPELPRALVDLLDARDLSFSRASTTILQPWFRCDLEAFLSLAKANLAPILARLA